jgi:hypothetical protein
VWGAQGGNTPRANGGKGGYSVGEIHRSATNMLYVYVGGQGPVATTEDLVSGGYNGGGGAAYNHSQPAYNATDGGATHIATIARGELKNYESYRTDVLIVAGGGGGGNDWQVQHIGKLGEYEQGGAGGGITGLTGSFDFHYAGTGGTQTSGGYAKGSSREAESYGSFGLGGYISGMAQGSAGGGGGWYGGAGGKGGNNNVCKPAGGGSGYVYTSSTASNYPSGCQLNSSYYLTNAQTIAGNTSFPSTSGSTETGHSGNGYVRITVISVNTDTAFYVKISQNIT